jgi:hypothetical protein
MNRQKSPFFMKLPRSDPRWGFQILYRLMWMGFWVIVLIASGASLPSCCGGDTDKDGVWDVSQTESTQAINATDSEAACLRYCYEKGGIHRHVYYGRATHKAYCMCADGDYYKGNMNSSHDNSE